jgi:hypothetical protein
MVLGKMVAKLVKEFILVFSLFMYASSWLWSWPTLLMCDGELIGPTFPEIDYVSDDVGIKRSIMLEELEKQKREFGDDDGDEEPGDADGDEPELDAEEEDRLERANEKFDLCCRQAKIYCGGNILRK